MRDKWLIHAVLGSVLTLAASPGLSGEPSPGNNGSKYLDAVREFADNVLKYGGDTYGPKHTPFFVDGVNVNTHEPVKWRRDGEVWILSNLASQQNLFRTLDGLTTVTGDPKYRQAAIEAIEYAFENLRSPNGLLHWGGHVAYNALADEKCMEAYVNELEHHYPYYELMWQADPIATRHVIEAFWSAHILDWSNLDMNRHGPMDKGFTNPWENQYQGGPVFFEGRGIPFHIAGSDLFYAGSMLYRLSGRIEPLIWSKRLAYRYIETRNPQIGLSATRYSKKPTQEIPLKVQLEDDFPGHLLEDGTEFPTYGHWVQFSPWICQLLLGETLASDGREFSQWAVEELTARGKVAYRQEDNSWIPMLSDGTSLEGYVCKKDGPLGPKGTRIVARPANSAAFRAYAMAWRMTTDAFLWQMARNIAKGNNVGDIGEDPNSKSRLDIGTAQANHNMLLGFLELFRKSEKEVYLKIAERIGSNILDSYFHNGFFVPSSKHLYAKFDNVAPLVLLHLATSLQTEAPRMPQVWPTSSYFHCPYDGFGRTYDWTVIYRQTEENHWDFEVFAAVHSGDVREVSEVISKGANINATNGSFWGDTPLHYAVRQGHKKIVELLLAKGADVNGRNRNGETPIDVVGSQDRHEIARLLVTHNATVSTIHTAARLGDAEQVRAFLERGSDVNAQNERGRTALYVAVSENCEDLAEFLIDNGADVNTKDNKGYTPLYEAIWNSDANMVDLLVTNGADVNYTPEKDYPPLHYAVWWWNLKIARSLVDHGADCDAKDQDGWTAFRYAVNSANKKMVDLFVAKGADVPGIHRAACLGDLARVKSFLEQGTDVDVKDEMGWTPLYWAASMGQEEVGEFLVGKRAQIDIRTKGQRAPLHQVACSGAFRLAELLISKGADVEAQDKRKETPLHSAAANNHRQIAELLIEKGADVNAATASGRTPLHSAAMYGNKDVVTLLLAKGADATIKDSRDRTAHDWAKLRGHTEVADMLLTALDLAAMTTEKSSKSHETIDVNQPTHQLFAAVKADDIEKVEASITDGADVNAKDATGRMPIHYAVANKHKEITELLTAIAVRPGTFEHLELRRVKRLTDQAIDVSSIGHSNTLLHLAAQAGYVYVAAYLIDQGADVDAKNRSGATPTQVAMEKHFNQPIAALLLLDAGATATDRERGIILLRAAQEQGTYGLRRAKYEDQTTPYLSTGGSRSKHDIAISKASVASACIQGGIIPITVTLENRGSYRESFNILLHDRIKEAPLFSESVIFAAPFEGVAHNTADIVFATETLPRSMFSNRVCIGGDVNKDGFADVLIGSVGWHDFRGRAYLYLGGTKMDSAADVILTGFSEGDGFSNNQGGAFGDVNGDGYDDVIIGARPPALLESHDGYVCVYYGGLDMDNSPDVVFRSPETGGEGRFGTVVAGDIDNDGYCDVLAGDSRWERAYLFWGGDPMRTNAETVFRGKNTGNYFGHRMAIGGDVNGDGYNDIIIGSRQGSEYQQGQAYLYFGNTKEEMDADCDWLFKGETAGDNLGSAVDIFDIDNDGYGDVIIGARYAPDNWRGRVYIYWGASDFDGSKPGVVLECNDISSMGEYLQCSYINDDHYGDILVGGWQYPGPPYKHGRAYLFYGNTRMAMDTDRDHIFEGEGCTDDYFGFQVGVGDVNGDGYADALVGSPGASHNMGCAYLYYGPFHSTTDITFNWDTTNASIGKHTLKVEVPPVPGEQNTEDNVKTVSVEIKERAR